ncbi:MAG: TIGR02556 family CRISPR-associated protein [Candidatus Magnetoovum sp. WYHC-5]|nr:TIGR02556 family CRISPR-associated protein [Candidatus Magnetoovum sp. WYHC-5]
MIEALRELGLYSLKSEGRSTANELEIMVQDPNVDKVILIKFKSDSGEVRYDGVDVEDMKGNYIKYLYRRKAPNGPNFTPSAKLTDNVQKTIDNRFIPWFKGRQGMLGNVTIQQIGNSFVQNMNTIVNQITEELNSYSKETFLITLLIDGKYLNEFNVMQDILIEGVKGKYGKVKTKDGVCSLCGKREEVFGNASPYTFYTLDKPGYVAGGFDDKQGWRNFPLCIECVLLIDEGRQYLEDTLGAFSFAKLSYYLIPRSITNNIDALTGVLTIYNDFRTKKIAIDEKHRKRLLSDEDDILYIIKDCNDSFVFTFLFYEKSNSRFAINLLIEDIYPSRLMEMFNAKSMAEDYSIFKNIVFSKKDTKDILFNFYVLRVFFNSIKEFLNITEQIFKKIPLNYDFVISKFIEYIRDRFVNDNYIKISALQSFVCLLFFNHFGLLNFNGGKQVKMDKRVMPSALELNEKIDGFFNSFSDAFSSYSMRAVFLMGVLTQLLLQIQGGDRSSTPFRKQLKGLKMKEDDICGLLPKIINKLEEYGKNYYKQLESIISFYFLNAGKDWHMSVDEINYYFVLGMNLYDATAIDGSFIFKSNKKGQEEGKDNE